MVFLLVPFRNTCMFFSGKLPVHVLRMKIEAFNVLLVCVRVWWEMFCWCCLFFILKGVLTLVSPVSFLLAEPDTLAVARSFLSFASPPHSVCVFCWPVCVPVCGHLCPSIALCRPSSLLLFCTFSRTLILIYKPGTLSFLISLASGPCGLLLCFPLSS